ncbi:MAG: GNAT family N-acetyltransferase [Treponema sp.]|nr:GNAT family N-acetyltransferase [Treponema sp.]
MKIEEKNYINLLEKIGSDVHPALEQQIVDGWICNFAEGYSRRANSVLAFDWGNNSEESIKTCESLYAKARLPCVFKMTDASAPGLKELLEKGGYNSEAPTDVMTVDCNSPVLLEKFETVEEPEEIGVIITGTPDEAWLNPFFEFENRTAPKTMEIVKRQFELISQNEKLTALYCRIQISGNDVGVASAVIEDGVLFLLNVVVNPACRGKGYGKILVKEILENACDMGAEKLCLQVVQENSVAINLYKSFGFEYLYTYWYMVKSKN